MAKANSTALSYTPVPEVAAGILNINSLKRLVSEVGTCYPLTARDLNIGDRMTVAQRASIGEYISYHAYDAASACRQKVEAMRVAA